MKPQCKQILAVLEDGNPHSAVEFIIGLHGKPILAVSQRVGDLRHHGYAIENVKKDGGVACYQLERS